MVTWTCAWTNHKFENKQAAIRSQYLLINAQILGDKRRNSLPRKKRRGVSGNKLNMEFPLL